MGTILLQQFDSSSLKALCDSVTGKAMAVEITCPWCDIVPSSIELVFSGLVNCNCFLGLAGLWRNYGNIAAEANGTFDVPWLEYNVNSEACIWRLDVDITPVTLFTGADSNCDNNTGRVIDTIRIEVLIGELGMFIWQKLLGSAVDAAVGGPAWSFYRKLTYGGGENCLNIPWPLVNSLNDCKAWTGLGYSACKDGDVSYCSTDAWANGLYYPVGVCVMNNSTQYICILAHTAGAANLWAAGVYNIGDRVYYTARNNNTYYCKQQTTAGEGAPPDEPAYWDLDNDEPGVGSAQAWYWDIV